MASTDDASAGSKVDADVFRESLELLRQTLCRYFRLEVHGGENLPQGRCMIVGCHGGVMPYDAACTLVAVEQETGRLALSLGANMWGQIELVDEFLSARGMFVGTREELARRLDEENIVLVMPGGTEDMTRPIWRDAYRVLPHKGFARGKGGYIKTALETVSPIVPLAIVGTEEAHGLLWNSTWLAGLLGTPFFPIVASPLPLPVKIYVRFGEPIHFAEEPEAANDQAVVDRLNLRVRRTVQELIDDTVERRSGIIWSSYDTSPRKPKRG
ncbi:MAG: lysophospholipid acyltransferase family protein [Candidatus Binatia bacterium]